MDSTTSKPPKRRYTVSEKVLAANRTNLVRARANPNTPARRRARLRNLQKAWARQRDPQAVPGCRFVHGAYSKDLRRTAPLAGEPEGELDRLLDRLLETFPLSEPYYAAGLRWAGERLWRVRRVLQSWVHRERLEFYQGLFEAAEEPGGLGVERVRALAARLARALDLSGAEAEGEARSLAAQQRRLRRAVEVWAETGVPGYGADSASRLSSRLGTRTRKRRGPAAIPAACDPGRWSGWLQRQFARRQWKLPPDAGGERLHYWLVRAAVVGGENVTGSFPVGLETEIARLAILTWERLGSRRENLTEATRDFEGRVTSAAETARQLAQEEDSEEAGWSPEKRRRAAWVLPHYQAELGMKLLAEPWLDVDAEQAAKYLALWNREVEEAIESVTLEVGAAALAESAAAQSGQPVP